MVDLESLYNRANFYVKPIIFGDFMEGRSFGWVLWTAQYQFAPKSSVLIGLMMQKDIGLHGIVLVVIVVAIHEVIHIL